MYPYVNVSTEDLAQLMLHKIEKGKTLHLPIRLREIMFNKLKEELGLDDPKNIAFLLEATDHEFTKYYISKTTPRLIREHRAAIKTLECINGLFGTSVEGAVRNCTWEVR